MDITGILSPPPSGTAPLTSVLPEEDAVATVLHNMRFLSTTPRPNSPHPAPSPILSVDQMNQLINKMCDTLKKDDDTLQLACLELFISQGLTFKFDGKQYNLPPWITKVCSLCTNA
jgi:hypothetical protein